MTLSIEVAIALLLCAWLVYSKLRFQAVVMGGMAFAAGLILAMAISSPDKPGVHPDEISHIGAYQYYVHHILPPAVNDPTTVPSTSVFGFSYLFELDVVYDISARVTGKIREWTANDYLSGRLFQFGLWVILCVLVMWRKHWAIVLCVALLTPQVWYIFSYFNGDAFPFFLALIATGLISERGNGLHRFLDRGDKWNPSFWLTVLCIGLLLVSKANYLPLVPVFILWLAVIHLNVRARVVALAIAGLLLLGVSIFLGNPNLAGESASLHRWHLPAQAMGLMCLIGAGSWILVCGWSDRLWRERMFRLAAFTVLCGVVAAPRVAWDLHVNGLSSHKQQLIHAVAEARAGHDFKPSVVSQGKGYPTRGLVYRGISLEEVAFYPYHWASISVESAFGVYAYMNKFAPRWLYFLLYGTFGATIVLSIVAVVSEAKESWCALLSVVLGGAVLVLTSSLLNSWTYDFQAQGRYLFPILPLLALLFGYIARESSKRVLTLLIAGGTLLSVYSFAFVALPAFTA